MLTYDEILEAQTYLVDKWGEDGKRVIETCLTMKPYNGPFSSFLHDHCCCCGGDWGGMILSGIHELFPQVWDAIPEHMGSYGFFCLCYTLQLLGVDTKEED